MALGTVSTANYTRAEIENMLKKAVYSEGKVVWSGSAEPKSSSTVPDEVDYISASHHYLTSDGESALKIARGYSATYRHTVPPPSGYTGAGVYEFTLAFSAEGILKTSYKLVSGSSRTVSGIYTLTGYHYY